MSKKRMLYNSGTFMPSDTLKRGVLIVAAVGLSFLGLGGFLVYATKPKQLVVTSDRETLPADGVSQARVVVRTDGGPLRGHMISTVWVPGKPAQQDDLDVDWKNEASLLVRAGAMPGEALVDISVNGKLRASHRIKLAAAFEDSFGDGYPRFMRLADAEDRSAFRQWFTLLAELQMANGESHLPKEISDCASLLRFAYRESLWRHTDAWKKQHLKNGVYEPASVQAYEVPYTPLGPNVFRVREGVFTEASLKDGSFAEFADAKTLMTLNAHFVGRDVSRALPGDLLFYRQLEQASQFHSMIFLGKSHFRNFAESSGVEDADWLVYHTGSVNSSKGQMKQVRVAELARHPDPKWRPLAGNSNFLGVFRWNILREAQ